MSPGSDQGYGYDGYAYAAAMFPPPPLPPVSEELRGMGAIYLVLKKDSYDPV